MTHRRTARFGVQSLIVAAMAATLPSVVVAQGAPEADADTALAPFFESSLRVVAHRGGSGGLHTGGAATDDHQPRRHAAQATRADSEACRSSVTIS